MSSLIRKVQQGDCQTLAHIQTESWKAAFVGIVPTDKGNPTFVYGTELW